MSNIFINGERTKSPLWAGLQASLVTGAAGFLVGGTVGIAKSKVPIALWTLVSSLQWGLLGGTYWGIRTALTQQIPEEEVTPQRRLFISATSGGLAFAVVGALTRGRRNIIPGTIMGSAFGFTGQGVYNILDQKHTAAVTTPVPRKTLWERITMSNWSPITKLSDEEYTTLLSEKLLRVEAEIAMLDDEIAELQEQGELPTAGNLTNRGGK